MNVLVTGGSGTIGKYIVAELIKHHKVGILDIKEPDCPTCRFHWVDIMNLAALTKVFSNYDAVVHLAGIPHPLNNPPEKVYSTNVLGTFNVMEAASNSDVKKVILASSESTLGFAFRSKDFSPDFIPIDENHPTNPQDAYGLSKIACEQILKGYSEKTGIQTISLRMPWVWVPEKELAPVYRNLISDYPKWYKNLWAYIHVYDAAIAFHLALITEELKNNEIFFITAAENWTGIESKILIQQFYPSVLKFATDYSGKQSLISYAKANRMLRYTPGYTHSDLFQQINQQRT